MRSRIVAALCCLLMGAAGAAAQTPLTESEIADAHTCIVEPPPLRLKQLAICAGDKVIGTGIFLDHAANGLAMPSSVVTEHWRMDKGHAFAVEIITSITQPARPAEGAEPETPAWSRRYYVVSDEQLARIIDLARKDPQWKP